MANEAKKSKLINVYFGVQYIMEGARNAGDLETVQKAEQELEDIAKQIEELDKLKGL